MLADQMPCNARNCFPGQVFNSRTEKINLYGKNVEVDYRGSEVSVANFIAVLTGRHEPGTPVSKKLDTDENSNIFIYMSGHGGDGFLKFQDFEEMSSQDLADSIQEMHVKKRYNEIFFMVDTCQAGSLSNAIQSPKVVTIGSSKTGENSYAHHSDFELGLSVIDRFTFSTLDYLQRIKVGDSIRNKTLQDLFNFYDPKMLSSTPEYRADILGRPIDEVPITDFLGSIIDVHLLKDEEAYPIKATPVSFDSKSDAPMSTIFDDSVKNTVLLSKNATSVGSQQFGFSKGFIAGAIATIITAVLVSAAMI
ncbi:hypothetical protein PsorP6_004029 [Peronosclerospora sorghi]|uniref:Uncharacterized protein n=1 Tax=Peronosclerospora sorghi TaxID=230839 RepID=A0ACC0VRF2_9STRA|nr:hypothetical protein PsorP6_004029 [Peronosclerospora sorghi]